MKKYILSILMMLAVLTASADCIWRVVNKPFPFSFSADYDGDICFTTSSGTNLVFTSPQDTALVQRLTTQCFRVSKGDYVTLSLEASGANRVCVNFLPAIATNLYSIQVTEENINVYHPGEYEIQYSDNPMRRWETLGQFSGNTKLSVVNKPGWNYYRIKSGEWISDVYSYNGQK